MAGPAGGKVQVGNTSKFSVLDAKGSKVKHVIPSPAAAPAASAVGDEGEQQVVCCSRCSCAYCVHYLGEGIGTRGWRLLSEGLVLPSGRSIIYIRTVITYPRYLWCRIAAYWTYVIFDSKMQ